MGGCLLDNVTTDKRIYKEEIFGPVLALVRARTYVEALKNLRIKARMRGISPEDCAQELIEEEGAADMQELRRMGGVTLEKISSHTKTDLREGLE
jgi:hypothetical protein